MDLKKLLEKLKKNEGKKGLSNKTTINLLIVFLIGVLILITGSFFKTTGNSVKETVSKNNNNDQVEEPIKEPEEETEKELKNELKNILQQTDGVGRVEVMIYLLVGRSKYQQ
ncbi:stage III sporulation protein AG [Clostridium tetanomorphum]|nr:stage III sporulation protein AG [Clostridium tetanomorphum]